MKSTVIKWASSLMILLMISIQFSCQNNNNIESIEPSKINDDSPYLNLPSETKRKIDIISEAMTKYSEIEKINRASLPSVEVFITNYLKEKGIDIGNNKPTSTKGARIANLPPNNDELAAEGYNLEFTDNNMPWAVRSIMNNFYNRINELANSLSSDDQAAINQFRAASNASAVEVNNSFSLTNDQKSEMLTAFYTAEGMTQGIYGHVLNNQNAWDSGQFSNTVSKEAKAARVMFFKKLFRAVARVLVAIVATAVIVATVVSTAGLIGAAGVALGVFKTSFVIGTAVKASLVKGISLGTFKVSGTIGTGLAAGLKNATKNWNKDWQGINEFVFGIKIKEVAVP
jgi:hypothetical protein